jgi:hypothetical protein
MAIPVHQAYPGFGCRKEPILEEESSMRAGRHAAYLFPLLMASSSAECRGADAPAARKPLFREFMGVCGHTIQFKPDVYAPACRAVRDYHPLDWDTGDDTSFTPPFPSARNGVNWREVYGAWKAAGFETEVSIMFDNLPAKSWKDLPRDALAYGRSFARSFGPSSASQLVAAAEVGNEPGLYDDETYRTLFRNMAAGLREGDPRLKVGPCAVTAGKSDRYARSVECLRGLEALYDFLNIHAYAEVEGYPTWRRSYPEDPKIDYLRRVDRLIAWRDRDAPDKEVRVTEFGWDASTKPAPASGTFSKWTGSTETEQARYLVRSFLLFSKRDVTRAYIFFFDDKDEPQVHGSSGLTRNGRPKPAFHAVAHLFRTLGDYRFRRVVEERPGDVFVYEYIHSGDAVRRIWAIWSPTGSGRRARIELDTAGMVPGELERMPLTAGRPGVERPPVRGGRIAVDCDESPVFLRWAAGPAAVDALGGAKP